MTSCLFFSHLGPRPDPPGRQRARAVERSPTAETETGCKSSRWQLCLLPVRPHTVLCLPVNTALSSQCPKERYTDTTKAIKYVLATVPHTSLSYSYCSITRFSFIKTSFNHNSSPLTDSHKQGLALLLLCVQQTERY